MMHHNATSVLNFGSIGLEPKTLDQTILLMQRYNFFSLDPSCSLTMKSLFAVTKILKVILTKLH